MLYKARLLTNCSLQALFLHLAKSYCNQLIKTGFQRPESKQVKADE